MGERAREEPLRELMRDFLTFYNKSSWVGRWTADGLATWVASDDSIA